MKKYRFGLGGLILTLLLLASAVLAQSGTGYDFSWWSVDGGGGSAIQSGAYTWGGTAGQHDAGTLVEGAYTLHGGFWGGVFSPVDYQSTQSGAWDTGGTWDQSAAPGYNAVVTISAGDTVTVSSAAQCYRLIVEHEGVLVIQEGAALTVGDSVVNAGTLRQTQNVNGIAAVAFLTLGDYRGVELATSNDLGSVTVTVRALAPGEYCTADGAASPPYAQRCFRIQPTHNLSATVRLWALTDEVGFGGTPAVFHNPGGTDVWTELTANASAGASGEYVYAEAETPGFSYFLLAESGQAPTLVGLRSFIAAGGVRVLLLMLVVGVGAVLLLRRRGRVTAA